MKRVGSAEWKREERNSAQLGSARHGTTRHGPSRLDSARLGFEEAVASRKARCGSQAVTSGDERRRASRAERNRAGPKPKLKPWAKAKEGRDSSSLAAVALAGEQADG